MEVGLVGMAVISSSRVGSTVVLWPERAGTSGIDLICPEVNGSLRFL